MKSKKNRYRTKRKKPGRVLAAWIAKALGHAVVFSGIILLSAALSHSYQALLRSPWFRIQEIRITGSQHLDRKDVLNLLKVPRNASVLSLHLSALAERLKSHKWVKSAVVWYAHPGQLVVEITERTPVAIIRAEDTFLVDAEGKLFTKADSDGQSRLPIVTGFSGMGLVEGGGLPAESLESLRLLLANLEKAKDWLPVNGILECHWQKDEGFTLYVTQKAIRVELGWDDYDEKMERLRKIFTIVKEREWLDLITRIDLDYSQKAYLEGNFPSPKGT